ncbi:MAG: D-glycero-alpha-D-manno-heptose-1,7-bisphosphate 7-phosphatase [Actinomycetota bacterium]
MAETFAVFLDRDGVICENRADHVRSWRDFTFLPGTIDAIASLRRAGAKIFIITNQAAVGRGLMTQGDLANIHAKMKEVLHGSGADVDGIYACTHHPADECACRKPGIALLAMAAEEHDIILEESFMVGDYVTDIEAGATAGCTTVLVRSGRGTQAERIIRTGEAIMPDAVCDDMVDAAFWILAERASAVATGRRTAAQRRREARNR